MIDNYQFLVEKIETEGPLLSYLFQHEVLDEHETAEIRALAVRHKKNEKLLDFILRSAPAQYEQFLEALNESGQEHVGSVLIGGNLTMFKIIYTKYLIVAKFS